MPTILVSIRYENAKLIRKHINSTKLSKISSFFNKNIKLIQLLQASLTDRFDVSIATVSDDVYIM